MILVDTNVWSELTKTPCDPNVSRWLQANSDGLWLSVIVFAEFRMSIENLPHGRKRNWLDTWFEGLSLEYGDRIVDFDAQAAAIFATLVVERKLQRQDTKQLDIQLAAQGLAHDAVIATRNVKDFAWTGVRLVDPWEA